jgi:hypothetical protein
VSTGRFTTIMDFARHRADMRIACECGRIINIPFPDVLARFGGMPISIEEARSRLKCKRCFKRGCAIVSPVPTVSRS